MRNFDWGFRATHLLGGIIEAFIILLCVAVIAGLIFLLVRYLLVATRASQLYVNAHEPRAGTNPAPTTPPAPPASPAAADNAVADAPEGTATPPAAKKSTRPKTPPTV